MKPKSLLQRLKGRNTASPLDRWRPKPLDRTALKALQIQDALAQTRGIDGAVVECGVGAGFSLAMFSMVLDGSGDGRRLWAFDSFEGFPEGGERDAAWFSAAKMPVYRAFDVPWVRAYIAGVTGRAHLSDRPTYVPGFFPASFERYDGGPVSLLHLDVDPYDSYVACFGFFAPKLSPGAMILLDEYDRGTDTEKWPGAKIAADEFAERHGLAIEKHYTGFAQIRVPATLARD